MNNLLKNALYGQITFRILHQGLHNGLFDVLSNSNTLSIDEVHDLYRYYNKSRLMRFLNAAVAAGLVCKNDCDCYYIKEDYKKFYTRGSEQCLDYMVGHLMENTENKIKRLDHILREGIGEKGDEDIFADLYSSEESVNSFLDAMWSIGYKDSLDITRKKEFRNYNTIVDIGGGPGSFSVACIKNNKSNVAIVFDLPNVKSYIENKRKTLNLDNKLVFQAGDFFKDAFPEADAYIFGYILSDWDDTTCKALLKRVFSSMRIGCDIIILERIFNSSKTEPFETAMMDLCMMVETKGRHRTYNEYKTLLESVGFSDVKLICSGGEKHAVCGRRVQ